MPGRVDFIAPCPGCGGDADWTAIHTMTAPGDDGPVRYEIEHDGPCNERNAA